MEEKPNPKNIGDDLLAEGKYYEYSQKMKLLANRRIQSSKIKEALTVLESAIRNLTIHNEINEADELTAKWIELLTEYNDQFDSER